METFIKNFRREGDGAWRCIAPAELQIAETTFTLGTMFMGIGLAALLEEHHRRHAKR